MHNLQWLFSLAWSKFQFKKKEKLFSFDYITRTVTINSSQNYKRKTSAVFLIFASYLMLHESLQFFPVSEVSITTKSKGKVCLGSE